MYDGSIKEIFIDQAGQCFRTLPLDYMNPRHIFVKGFEGGFHGSALKIFEYMAMAKPVIAPPMGQICELIENGVSGYLVESDNSKQIAKIIEDLYRNPNLCRQLGTNARKRVIESYTWQINADRVRRLCKMAYHA